MKLERQEETEQDVQSGLGAVRQGRRAWTRRRPSGPANDCSANMPKCVSSSRPRRAAKESTSNSATSASITTCHGTRCASSSASAASTATGKTRSCRSTTCSTKATVEDKVQAYFEDRLERAATALAKVTGEDPEEIKGTLNGQLESEIDPDEDLQAGAGRRESQQANAEGNRTKRSNGRSARMKSPRRACSAIVELFVRQISARTRQRLEPCRSATLHGALPGRASPATTEKGRILRVSCAGSAGAVETPGTISTGHVRP